MTHTKIRRLVLSAIVLAACAGCSNSDAPLEPSPPADFSGHFSGTSHVRGCTDTGDFAGSCEASGFTTGDVLPIQLTLQQEKNNVTGDISLGGLLGSFQGTASGNTLDGWGTMKDETQSGLTIQTSVTGWHSTISNSALSGEFGVVFKEASLTGNVTISAVIDQLTR
jgi:hypothetical protein